MELFGLFLLFVVTSVFAQSEYESSADEEVLIRERRAINFYRTGHKTQAEMSRTLTQLLGPHYNKRIRPSYGGPPIKVILNLSIRSIGPVNEKKQDFYIDCYFRQSWVDTRLIFNTSEGVNELPLNWQFLNKIWKPDTFFVNGKKSKMHKITVPNKFLRIAPDGRVSYSQRLTIHARCKMHLLKFPLDSQVCPLLIGSYGYASRDVLFEWRKPSGVVIDDLQMAQFHMTKYEQGVINDKTMRLIESGFRNDSVAYLYFYFERQTGFFLLQIYTPLFVIVMCSWVAFWIVKTDAPARCGLGITTVLSVTKIGFGGKGKPQVGYPTAMDIFVVICLGSVFAALCEFAIINFISVSMNRYKTKEKELKDAQEKARELVEQAEKVMKELKVEENGIIDHEEAEGNNPFEEEEEEKPTVRKRSIETMDASTTTEDFHRRKMSFDLGQKVAKMKAWGHVAWQRMLTRPKWMRVKPVNEMYIYTNTEEALDIIDDYSKICFPIAFLTLMFFYWTSYLYIIEDKLEMDTF